MGAGRKPDSLSLQRTFPPTPRGLDAETIVSSLSDLHCSHRESLLLVCALSAHKTFDLVGCPGNRLIDAFALLRAARDHLRYRRLRIHLGSDRGRGRRTGDRSHEVLARRVIV